MVHAVTLAFAVSVVIDPAMCRQSRTGSAAWQTDGRGGISASTDARTTADLVLNCRVPVPKGVTSVTLQLDRALVSFQPAGSKTNGSGLLLSVGRGCRAELIRVAGEDWIETPRRAWAVKLPRGSRHLEVQVTARDLSAADPLRIDIQGLRVSAGQANDAQACQSAETESNRDGRPEAPGSWEVRPAVGPSPVVHTNRTVRRTGACQTWKLGGQAYRAKRGARRKRARHL
jgi:hypothetical protein